MNKVKIESYIKHTPTRKTTTSVNIETRHLDYIQKKNVNLSKLVRDTIDEMIATDKRGGK